MPLASEQDVTVGKDAEGRTDRLTIAIDRIVAATRKTYSTFVSVTAIFEEICIDVVVRVLLRLLSAAREKTDAQGRGQCTDGKCET